MEAVARGDGQAREGLFVPVLRPNHQVGVHATPAPPLRPLPARSVGMGSVLDDLAQHSGVGAGHSAGEQISGASQ